MKSIKAFESDEQVQWKRETLPAATKSVLRSQWTRWKYKEPGEDWLTMPTDRFLQFIKSVMHSYFKEAVDSGLTDPYIRIIQVLTKEKIFLEATTAVRQLEELGGAFEEAEVFNTDMSKFNSLELEQTKSAFRENIVPVDQFNHNSARYVTPYSPKDQRVSSREVP
jgi:hypothetical protein